MKILKKRVQKTDADFWKELIPRDYNLGKSVKPI